MSAILVKSFVGQAEVYFEKELINKRENYYSEEVVRIGQWTGKGAEALGLKGEIKKEDFSRLSRGINPITGARFRRMTLGRTREIDGWIKQVKEIAGWDMVISAPKTVSIIASVGKDKRVRRAHEESITDALDRAEEQAQANNGGGKREQTNNLVIGRFQHDSARPSKDGLVAPQLHDHCFILNITLRADGTWKPLDSLELHRAQNYIKSVYYTGLADRLQKLGYEIEIDPETGAPEIIGISKEYRLACSPRRTEILELAGKAGKNYRRLGLVNRREKIFDKNLIQEQHKTIDKSFDYQAERVVKAARTNPPAKVMPDMAKEVVAFALAKLSKRELIFNPRQILHEANKRGIGHTSVAAIEAELEILKKEETIKTVSLRDGRKAAFLSSNEQIEVKSPQFIKNLKPQETLHDEILKIKLSESGRDFANNEFHKLSGVQQNSVREIMKAKTGVVTMEGRTEVGTTNTLSFVNRLAITAEYEVLGLAAKTDAAQKLDKAQITSSTLQKLLSDNDSQREQKRFYIVDESSFVSSRQMDKFFREAVKSNDRVLLFGDASRHEDIEAGKSIARIQSEKLADGAKPETIKRQTKDSDRETVKNLSEQKIVESVEEMRQRGQVREIKDRSERHRSIVRAFIAEPEKTIVVAPRNADRQEINSKIHAGLKEVGKIGKEEIEIKILRPRRELNDSEREFAAAYREGDIISYTRGSAENKIAAKSLARVVRTDRRQNLLTVEIKDGRSGKEAREITYNPKRLRGVSVWTEENIKVSEGDRLQFHAPFETKQIKISKETICEVSKITTDTLTLTTGNGKFIKLEKNKPQAIDYGYAVSSYHSQDKTIDRVLIHAETSESAQVLNEKMAYVTVSHARDEALIFTDDADNLTNKMARRVEKSDITRTETKPIEYTPPVVKIKSPIILPAVEKSPIPEIKAQPAREKAITTPSEPKNRQEILIREVLQLSRETLAKQDIKPTKAWELFKNEFINSAATQEANETHKYYLDILQKDVPESERIVAEGKSRLEATHIILKLASDAQRNEIVKGTLAYYEDEIRAERTRQAELKAKATEKTISSEKAAVAQIKPSPKVRNFEAIDREKLIEELVAAANEEARNWKGEDLSYRQQKRLVKTYRKSGDDKPLDTQINDLKILQTRFSEPLPEPKTYLEAAILKRDNMTDSERSRSIRGQITRFDELIKREEFQKAQFDQILGRTDKYDTFGRTDSYFTQELHRAKIEPDRKSYFELTREAQQRGFMPPPSTMQEQFQEKQTQDALYQMGIANAMQEMMNKNLNEQGIKLDSLAQGIINNSVDYWAKQQPTNEDFNRVQEINQMIGRGFKPENKLEAKAYVYANSDERERDQISSSLASTANTRAAEIKAEEVKDDEDVEMKNPLYDDYSQEISM